MKKLCAALTCLIVAISSCSLYACENGTGGHEGEDPANHSHVYSVTWDWNVDNIEAPNVMPTAQVSCTVSGCTADAATLKKSFDGYRGEYDTYVYTLYNTDNLPTEDSEGIGTKHVYAVKKDDATQARVFEDTYEVVTERLTPVVPVQGPLYDYLTATTAKEQYQVLSGHFLSTQSTDYSVKVATYTISLGISPAGAKLSIYDISAGFENKTLFTSTTSFSSSYVNYDYLPQRTYYWEVTKGSELLQNGTFKFSDDISVRYVSVGGVSNFRDLGGWTMGNGKPMPYGLIYRSARLDDITAAGRATIQRLGIKTELDLRGLDNTTEPVNPQIAGMNYYKYYTTLHYDTLIKNINSSLATSSGGRTDTAVGKYGEGFRTHKEAYQDIFAVLADESNYPIVFNCTSGADRTGTLAFLIEGLLGVSQEELVKDYELTSFSGSSRNRWRSDANATKDGFSGGVYTLTGWNARYSPLVAEMQSYAGDTLSEQIENCLLTQFGIPQNQIDSIKAIFGYTK